MTEETTNLVDKVEHAYRLLDTTYLLRNEEFNDHCKRSVLRFFFIQIDNLLKLVPRLKNAFTKVGTLAGEQKKGFETSIATLRHSYDKSFDVIRDKIAAHGQPLDLISLLDWWGALDYSTIEVLYGDAKEVQSQMEVAVGKRLLTIPDYQRLVVGSGKLVENSAAVQPRIAVDRFAAARPSTVYMLSCHSTQEKAQVVVSIIDFLESDFALTALVDNPRTIYTKYAFDIGWLLIVIDLCSFLDNLFTDNQYGRSLMSLWRDESIGGYSLLAREDTKRDATLEAQMRDVRNQLAAHIDDTRSLHELIGSFESLDLAAVHAYAARLINSFFSACRMDVRTKLFLIRDMPLSGVASIQSNPIPFDK